MDNFGGDEQGRSDEEWRPVIGHEDRYEVSDLGRVRSLPRTVMRRGGVSQKCGGKILKTHVVDGSRRVNVGSTTPVSRLVYLAFVGFLEPGVYVFHRVDKMDDRPTNLTTEAPRKSHLPSEGLTSYSGAHQRVGRMWGSASLYACISCGRSAREWAYDGSDPEQIYGPSQPNNAGASWCYYSPWPEFYMPMCAKCHFALDTSFAASELREYRAWKIRNPGKTLTDLEDAA